MPRPLISKKQQNPFALSLPSDHTMFIIPDTSYIFKHIVIIPDTSLSKLPALKAELELMELTSNYKSNSNSASTSSEETAVKEVLRLDVDGEIFSDILIYLDSGIVPEYRKDDGGLDVERCEKACELLKRLGMEEILAEVREMWELERKMTEL